MRAFVSQLFATQYGENLIPPYGAYGTTATSSTTPGTFGSIVQLAASTDQDAYGLILSSVCYANSGSDRQQVKLYVGASGSEIEIATVAVGGYIWTGAHQIPVFIPKGSRLSFAVAASAASAINVDVVVGLCRGSSGARLTSFGRIIGIASGDWVQVNGSPSGGVKSGWVEIIGSTSNDAKGFTFVQARDSAAGSTAAYLTDVGIGAAAAEVAILTPLFGMGIGYTAHLGPSVVGPIWTPIPAGSRIAVRSGGDASATTAAIRAALTLWE